jgi:hypothetical protein
MEKEYRIKKGSDEVQKQINEGRKSIANTIPARIHLDLHLISFSDKMRYSDILKYTDKGGLTVVLGSNHNVTLKTDTRIPSSHATYLPSWSIRPKHTCIAFVEGTDKICCG